MIFRYVSYTRDRGLTKGTVEARSAREAHSLLLRQGYKPLRLSPVRRLPSLETIFPSFFRVGSQDLIRFCHHLSTILSGGGHLIKALEMLQAETRSRSMQSTLETIRKRLDEGMSLSKAMAEHPQVFSNLFTSVVEIGEQTGQLGPGLEQMAGILEKEQEARQKAIHTMMYPVVIMVLSIVTLGVLMTVALPKLLQVFHQMGTDVPFMTRVAVSVVNGIAHHYLKIIVGIVALIALVWLLFRIVSVRHAAHLLQTRLPVLGPFIVAGEVARFSQTMALLLEAGVSLSTALGFGINSCKNLLIKEALHDAEESLISGHSLTTALRQHSVLPGLFVELVAIGEDGNFLLKTMTDAALTYQKQVDQRLNGLLAMLEPVSTVMVGLVVGFIAFSMFMPIYSGLDALR